MDRSVAQELLRLLVAVHEETDGLQHAVAEQWTFRFHMLTNCKVTNRTNLIQILNRDRDCACAEWYTAPNVTVC